LNKISKFISNFNGHKLVITNLNENIDNSHQDEFEDKLKGLMQRYK